MQIIWQDGQIYPRFRKSKIDCIDWVLQVILRQVVKAHTVHWGGGCDGGRDSRQEER